MRMPDAAERKVLIITTFVSACLALAPREWTSAGVLLVATGILFAVDRRLAQRTQREQALREQALRPPAPAPAEPAPPPAHVDAVG